MEGLLSFQLYSRAAWARQSEQSAPADEATPTHLLHQHEALGIRDDLGGVQGLLEIIEELGLVALKLAASAADVLELGRSRGTFVLDAGQAAGQDGLGDQGDRHAEVERIDGGPLAGTLLAGLVEDLVHEGLSVVVVEVHYVAGDFDEERVQDSLVPLGQHVADFFAGHAETTLHDVVCLGRGTWQVSLEPDHDKGGAPRPTSHMSCMSPYSMPLWTILT